MVQPPASAFAEIIKAIESPVYSHISFDVFDTLVCRGLWEPTDLFWIMNPAVFKASGGKVVDFNLRRMEAEQALREASSQEEVSLGAIYEQLGKDLRLEPGLVTRLRDLEEETETRFCQVRPAGKKLWEAACKAGKKVVYVSDMYLSRDRLKQILLNCGYTDVRNLYVSSSYGVTKHSGKLFEKVLAMEGIASSAMLHLGDNLHADITPAARLGIPAMMLPRSVAMAKQHVAYSSLFQSTNAGSHSIVKGLLAEHLFDMPESQGDPSLFQRSRYSLGYACLGPVITGFALWLARRAKTEQISRLYFQSREGWILQQAYELLAPYGDFGIPSSYFYSSRRAVFCAYTHSAEDIRTVVDMIPIFSSVQFPDELLNSFFNVVVPPSDDTHNQRNSLKDTLLSLCYEHKEAILNEMRVERENYLLYAKREGLEKEVKPAIVDSGGSGTIQLGLNLLLGRQIPGYYVYTVDRFLQLGDTCGPSQAWVKNFTRIDLPDAPIMLSQVFFSEILLGHGEYSLKRIGRDGAGNSVPEWFEALRGNAERERCAFIAEVQRGALAFVSDFAKRLGDSVRNAHIDPNFAWSFFRAMFTHGTSDDADLWKGQFGESNFNGMQLKPLTCTGKDNETRFILTHITQKIVPLDIGSGFDSVSLDTMYACPFDPSLRSGLFSLPVLRMPDMVKGPEDYALVGSALREAALAGLRHILGPEELLRFQNNKEYQDDAGYLARTYERLIVERHLSYIRQKSGALAGKKVHFFGCGVAYQAYKHFFRQTLPCTMLLNMVLPGGNPKEVDGIPVCHPRKVLGAGEKLPVVLFARKEHLNDMLGYLETRFPEYTGNLITSCVYLK